MHTLQHRPPVPSPSHDAPYLLDFANRDMSSCGVCGHPATSCCAKCKAVFYCSKEHQRSHWKTHKKVCNKAGPSPDRGAAKRSKTPPRGLPHWLLQYLAIAHIQQPLLDGMLAKPPQEAESSVPTPCDALPKTIKSSLNVPVPFPGTEEECLENLATHDWPARSDFIPKETSCRRCKAKVLHKASTYPCGEEPPRQMLVHYTDGTSETMSLQRFKELQDLEEALQEQQAALIPCNTNTRPRPLLENGGSMEDVD